MDYNIKKYFPFVLFVGLFIILHLIMGFNGDDIKFAKVLSNQSLIDYINFRYHNWSSRLIIDAFIAVLTRYNMIIWKILDIIIYTCGVYYIINLVSRDYSKKIACFGVMLFLMYPFYEMASAGWISTTLNYSWCFGLGMISFIPVIYEIQGKNVKWYMYVISFLALIYATNQEQSAALILGFNALYLVNCVINRKSINRFNVLASITVAAALIFMITCPGNSARFVEEVAYWYPGFVNLSIMQKAYLGLVTTFGAIIRQKIIFSIFYIILNAYLLVKCKNKNIKYFCYFNIFLLIFILVFTTLIDVSALDTSLKSLGNILSFIESSPLIGITELAKQIVNALPFISEPLKLFSYESIPPLSMNAIGIIIICIYLLLSSCAMLFMAFEKKLLPLFIFLAGFISRFIVGFSPVIFPSGARVTIFFYIAMITVTLMIIKKIYSENLLSSKAEFILEKSVLAVAIINYLIVFAISFVKYGIV